MSGSKSKRERILEAGKTTTLMSRIFQRLKMRPGMKKNSNKIEQDIDKELMQVEAKTKNKKVQKASKTEEKLAAKKKSASKIAEKK